MGHRNALWKKVKIQQKQMAQIGHHKNCWNYLTCINGDFWVRWKLFDSIRNEEKHYLHCTRHSHQTRHISLCCKIRPLFLCYIFLLWCITLAQTYPMHCSKKIIINSSLRRLTDGYWVDIVLGSQEDCLLLASCCWNSCCVLLWLAEPNTATPVDSRVFHGAAASSSSRDETEGQNQNAASSSCFHTVPDELRMYTHLVDVLCWRLCSVPC